MAGMLGSASGSCLDGPTSAWLPITRASMMCATTAFLFSELRDLRLPGWTRVPDGDTPESAVVHRFARGLLVLELSDQLALRFAERMGDIRVVSDGHQRRMAGQPR